MYLLPFMEPEQAFLEFFFQFKRVNNFIPFQSRGVSGSSVFPDTLPGRTGCVVLFDDSMAFSFPEDKFHGWKVIVVERVPYFVDVVDQFYTFFLI